MELCHYFFSALQVIIPEALNHAPGHYAEHRRFLVIPVAGNGIHSKILPHAAKDGIGLRKRRLVVYKYGHRLSGDIPPAHPETEAFGKGRSLPRAVKHGVFQEIGVAGTVHPYIRADKYVTPSKL